MAAPHILVTLGNNDPATYLTCAASDQLVNEVTIYDGLFPSS